MDFHVYVMMHTRVEIEQFLTRVPASERLRLVQLTPHSSGNLPLSTHLMQTCSEDIFIYVRIAWPHSRPWTQLDYRQN